VPARNDTELVVRNEAAGRFELPVDGGMATLEYERVEEAIVLSHTAVPADAEGQGAGGRVARAALEYARENRLLVVPRCRFVRAWIRRHPEYRDLLPS
jgi:predicted GNAT family acetyltransferase